MITTRQKWALGGLLSLSAAIWTPQLLARAGSTTSSDIAPDGPSATEIALMEQGFSAGEGAINAAPAPSPPSTATAPADTEGAADARDGDSSLVGPDALARSIAAALGSGPAFGSAGRRTALDFSRLHERDSEATGSPHGPPRSDDLMATSAMLSFLTEYPLRGTLVGASRSHALFGPHRVEVGDLLPGTAAQVVSISRGRAVIEEAGVSIEVELEPLRTSEARMRAAQTAGAGATLGSGMAASAADASVAPGPLSPPVESVPGGGLQ